MKIGAAGFIVPFMFVYEPSLLMIGDWPTILWRFVASCIGIGMFAGGLHGYFLTRASLWQRAVLVGAGLTLIVPEPLTDAIGFGLGVLVIASQVFARRSAREAARL